MLETPVFRQFNELDIKKSSGKARDADAFGKAFVELGHLTPFHHIHKINSIMLSDYITGYIYSNFYNDPAWYGGLVAEGYGIGKYWFLVFMYSNTINVAHHATI
jgi:hypothetical protein